MGTKKKISSVVGLVASAADKATARADAAESDANSLRIINLSLRTQVADLRKENEALKLRLKKLRRRK